MQDLFRINVVYSTQHLIFPTIVITILVLLGAAIILIEGRAKARAGKKIFEKPERFFKENYDKVKLWCSLALLMVYFFLLDKIGFTICSMIFLFLFNTLFGGKENLKKKKYLLNSVLVSVIPTLVISILFGTVFDITLPQGICSIELTSLGLMIF